MAFQAPAPDPMGGGAPMGANPDDLLQQIRDLLDQYLAMGAGTPVEHQAQALADAIDSTMGSAGPGDMGGLQDMGAPTDQLAPPDDGTQPQVPPDKQPGGVDMTEPPPSDSKTYAGANVSALDRLKKRNAKQSKG